MALAETKILNGFKILLAIQKATAMFGKDCARSGNILPYLFTCAIGD